VTDRRETLVEACGTVSGSCFLKTSQNERLTLSAWFGAAAHELGLSPESIRANHHFFQPLLYQC
jgi:hypothetical protein